MAFKIVAINQYCDNNGGEAHLSCLIYTWLKTNESVIVYCYSNQINDIIKSNVTCNAMYFFLKLCPY